MINEVHKRKVQIASHAIVSSCRSNGAGSGYALVHADSLATIADYLGEEMGEAMRQEIMATLLGEDSITSAKRAVREKVYQIFTRVQLTIEEAINEAVEHGHNRPSYNPEAE